MTWISNKTQSVPQTNWKKYYQNALDSELIKTSCKFCDFCGALWFLYFLKFVIWGLYFLFVMNNSFCDSLVFVIWYFLRVSRNLWASGVTKLDCAPVQWLNTQSLAQGCTASHLSWATYSSVDLGSLLHLSGPLLPLLWRQQAQQAVVRIKWVTARTAPRIWSSVGTRGNYAYLPGTCAVTSAGWFPRSGRCGLRAPLD